MSTLKWLRACQLTALTSFPLHAINSKKCIIYKICLTKVAIIILKKWLSRVDSIVVYCSAKKEDEKKITSFTYSYFTTKSKI